MITPGIADFLLARIAEDEAAVPSIDCPCGETPTHPLPHCGARVIAECESKRQIVAKADEAGAQRERYSDGDLARIYGGRGALAEHMLCLLALPYADHPDYDEAWRP